MNDVACSIIIPTFNRRDVLQICLNAFANQSVPAGTFELVVGDDGSSDGTSDMVEDWAKKRTIPVQLFRQTNAGANAARNAAIRRAAGPLLLFVNDDTIPVPSLVESHLALHAAHPALEVSVLGRMTISPDVPPSLFSALHHDASFDLFTGLTELPWDAFFTCNLSVKREFLLQYGLFDEGLRWHEDIELGERLALHGLRLLYCPEALGYHHHQLTERDYLHIAHKEGQALALWHLKRHVELRPDNDIVRAALHPRFRHRVADWALTQRTVPVALSIARYSASRWPGMARAVYAKVFQRQKRASMRAALKTAGSDSSSLSG